MSWRFFVDRGGTFTDVVGIDPHGQRWVKKLLSEKRLDLDITTGAIDLLSEQGYDPQYGARPLKRVIQRMLQDPLAIQILEGKFPEGSKIRVDVGSNGEDLEFERYS